MADNKKEINDKELENINSGMKIIIPELRNKFIDYFKKLIEKTKKK